VACVMMVGRQQRIRRVTDDDIFAAFWNERRVENAGETRVLAKMGYLNRITLLN
jgi:hypothetical protein